MNLDLSNLSSADQSALAGLLSKLQPMAATATEKKKRTAKPETIKYMTEDQISRFFSVIKSPRDAAIFRVIYHRGLRASELGMINLSQVDPGSGRIQFERLKRSYGGQFRMSSSEERAMKAWLRVRGTDPGPLFPSREGHPISRKMLDVLVKKYCQLAGIPADLAHCHTLKHSCGTHMLAKGVSLEATQDHLGHRSIKNTQIYAKFTSRESTDKRLRDW